MLISATINRIRSHYLLLISFLKLVHKIAVHHTKIKPWTMGVIEDKINRTHIQKYHFMHALHTYFHNVKELSGDKCVTKKNYTQSQLL
jgi:hypothetical protein